MSWTLFLQNYDYNRPNINKFSHVGILSKMRNILIFEQVLSIKQSTDSQIVPIHEKLEYSDILCYELRDVLAYRTYGKKLLFYVSSELIDNVISTFHNNVGHIIGMNKKLALVNNSYWFPKMRDKIKHYISKCVN